MPKPNPHLLTREQMLKTLDEGGSVMTPQGKIITNKAELPGEAEIALMTGDSARGAAAEHELEEKIAQDRARLDVLKGRRQEQEKEAAKAGTSEAAPAPADTQQTTKPAPIEGQAAASQPAPARGQGQESGQSKPK